MIEALLRESSSVGTRSSENDKELNIIGRRQGFRERRIELWVLVISFISSRPRLHLQAARAAFPFH